MNKSQLFSRIVCFTIALGCGSIASAQTWTLEHIRSVEGFQTPECAEVLPEDGTVYVSNIFAVTRDTIQALDANGYISTLSPGGEVIERKTVQSTENVQVHGASGMCFFKDYLYFNDRNGLKRCPLDDPSAVEIVPVPGTDHGFNDAGCDDEFVYVTGQDAIFRVNIEGEGGKFVDLKGVNGVKCLNSEMYAVTTDGEHSDLYELDPSGENPPKPFGLAPQFAGIDGIVVLEDGTFLITDCHGHKVYTIAPDRKTVTLVAEGLEYPADLDVDHERGLVYIPQFFRNTVEVYRLKSSE
jgi:hypothetical protein